MRYTLKQLEVFVAVSKTESVSRACEMLALSQSATSTALIEFEKQFDVQLFDRVGKSLRINEIGRQLLPKAVDLLDRAREVESLLQGRQAIAHLKIGATLTIGNYLATLLIARFLQSHPQAHLQLQVHNTSTIVQQILQHELDLGMIEGECNHADIEVIPWIADELVVFAHPSHPLAGQAKVSKAELMQQTWILREQGSGTRETFNRAFHGDYARLKIQLELEHTEAIKRAVEAGLGIGCISRLALKDAFRRGSLVPLETDELTFDRYFYFLRHKHKFQSAGIRQFLALCEAFTAGCARSDLIPLPEIA